MGSSGSGGKGGGLVESLLNPVGYVIPAFAKFDPLTQRVAPAVDKLLGTQGYNYYDEEARKAYENAFAFTTPQNEVIPSSSQEVAVQTSDSQVYQQQARQTNKLPWNIGGNFSISNFVQVAPDMNKHFDRANTPSQTYDISKMFSLLSVPDKKGANLNG